MLLTPKRVFDAYNAVHVEAGLQPIPDYRYPMLRRAFMEFVEFCESNAIDPERWMRAKLDAGKGRFRLKVTELSRHTPAFMAKFVEFGDARQAEAQSQTRIAASGVTDTSSDVTYLAEAMRRAYRDRPAMCEIFAGYSADSPVCLSCRACVGVR